MSCDWLPCVTLLTSDWSRGRTYGEHKRHLEFSEEQYQELQRHAAEQRVFFTASAMDSVSAQFLHSINVPFIKVGPSGINKYYIVSIYLK